MSGISDNDLKNVENARESQLEIIKSGDKVAARFIYYFSWLITQSTVI